MMDPHLPARLLAEARILAPVPPDRSRLMPFKEVILTLRAKRVSHERIAAMLKVHGITIERSAIGHFCRRHCTSAELQRVRRDLVFAATGSSAAASLSAERPAAAPGKRAPRIARDDL